MLIAGTGIIFSMIGTLFVKIMIMKVHLLPVYKMP
jgi:hypothetical protein